MTKTCFRNDAKVIYLNDIFVARRAKLRRTHLFHSAGNLWPHYANHPNLFSLFFPVQFKTRCQFPSHICVSC